MDNLHKLLEQELGMLQLKIKQELHSDVSLINDIGTHIGTQGGKRLRPIVVLLGGKCFNQAPEPLVTLAAVVEFFHISSLLHDDVIDNASIRRNQPTAHTIWGNKTTILVGDYLFSKAFHMLATLNNNNIMSVLAKASNTITKGEVQQLLYTNNPDVTMQEYISIIHHKTAVLFEAAAQMGPLLAKAKPEHVNALGQYGKYLGRAFQIVDDILDYQPSNKNLGKNIGNDLAEGKLTIPLIYAMQQGNQQQAETIRQAIRQSSTKNLPQIQAIIKETAAMEKSRELALEQLTTAKQALQSLPPSIYVSALEELVDSIVDRTY